MMLRPIPLSPFKPVDIPISNNTTTDSEVFESSKVPFSPIQYSEITNPRKRRALLPRNDNIPQVENKSTSATSVPLIPQEILNMYLPMYQAQLLLQQNMLKQTLMSQNLSNQVTQQPNYQSYQPNYQSYQSSTQPMKNKKAIPVKPINTYPQKRKLQLTPLDILVEVATTHPDFADGFKKEDNVFCSTCCHYRPSYCFREVKKANCKNMCIDCIKIRQRYYYRTIKSRN